jgi:hypothetical protein
MASNPYKCKVEQNTKDHHWQQNIPPTVKSAISQTLPRIWT